MCFCHGRLYTLEEDPEIEEEYERGAKCRLAVYSGINEDTLVRLDTLDFEEFIVGGYMQPGVGHNTDLIYVSAHGHGGSMYEVKYESNKLALGTHLTCVKDSGAQNCDLCRHSVCL